MYIMFLDFEDWSKQISSKDPASKQTDGAIYICRIPQNLKGFRTNTSLLGWPHRVSPR